jgi:flagellar biosynthesis GTPase FlhF
MKNRAILLLLGLIISSNSLFCQVSKDTVKADDIYPRLYDYFSPEESWQIHKEAYLKKLEVLGFSKSEIDIKMREYEKQKNEFIEKTSEQRKLAEKQRQLAEIQRKQAEEQRKEAEVQRQEAGKERLLAEIQRKQAEEQRKQAELQRLEAEKQRLQAAGQRIEAEAQRKIAEEQRKIAEEWRNSIKNLLNEDFTMSGEDSKMKSVNIKVTNENALFFNINGEINSGNILIEILNPNGKKEGELSLEHRQNSTPKTGTMYSGKTSGSLNKTINSPESGEWSVKFTSEKSIGHVNISVSQYIKQTVNEYCY